MKKSIVIMLLIVVGIFGSGCTNRDVTAEVDANLSVEEKIEAQLTKFRETAEYARSEEVDKDTLIAKLEEHHAAFRQLEIEYANQSEGLDPYSDNTCVFLMSINERINGLTSLVIHYGIEQNGALSIENQFSDETIDMFEDILYTGVGPVHNTTNN
jgi:uncharacterized protein YfcZ (UPF0381/DUF406 family)